MCYLVSPPLLPRYEYRNMMVLSLGLPLLSQACGISAVLIYSAEVRAHRDLSVSVRQGGGAAL